MKATIGCFLGVGGVCGAGYGATYILSKEPSYITVAEADKSIESKRYEGKLGGVENNRKYLVDGENENNRSWWEWSFDYRYKKEDESKLSDHFKKVIDGYSSSVTKSLHTTCISAYEKDKNQLSSGGSNPSIKNDVKKFCASGMENKELDDPS